jgi:hypothetical protein
MNEKFQKLMDKKRKMGKTLSPVESAAKSSVLDDLKGMAGEAMSHKLNGLKKVSVASDSEAGLKHGLEKAHEIVSGKEEHDMKNDVDGGEQDLGDEQGASDDHYPTHKESEHMGMPSGDQGDSSGGSLMPDSDEEMSDKPHEHMSHEELDAEIKKLEAMKKAKKPVHSPY